MPHRWDHFEDVEDTRSTPDPDRFGGSSVVREIARAAETVGDPPDTSGLTSGEGAADIDLQNMIDMSQRAVTPPQFWTRSNPRGSNYDPKFQFRYRVYIPGMMLEDARKGTYGRDLFADRPDMDGGLLWYAKSVDKPGITLEDPDRNAYYNSSFKVDPKPRVTTPSYKEIQMTLVDPTYPNVTRKIARLFRRGGLNEQQSRDIIKSKGQEPYESFLETIGEIRIYQLDENGRPLEQWTLYGAYPSTVDFGKLDYSSNDLVEISLTWYYTRFQVKFYNMGGETEYTYFANSPTTLVLSKEEKDIVCRRKYENYSRGISDPMSYEDYKKAVCKIVAAAADPPAPTPAPNTGASTEDPAGSSTDADVAPSEDEEVAPGPSQGTDSPLDFEGDIPVIPP